MQKTEKLILDLKERVIKAFETKDPYLVLYGSAVHGKITSDFDICLFLHTYSKEDVQLLKKIIVDFHKDNSLKLEYEVPYENKIIYSFKDILNVIDFSPFDIVGDNIVIKKIEKSQDFLKSLHIKLRLLFFVLTSDSLLILGNNDIFNMYKSLAFKTLVKTIFAYTYNFPITQETFLQYLLKDPYTSRRAEMYIGYKNRLPLIKYLKSSIKTTFVELYNEKHMLKLRNNAYKFTEDSLEDFKFNMYNKPSNTNIRKNLPSSYKKLQTFDFAENANPLGPSSIMSDSIKFFSKYANIYPDYKNIEINRHLSDFIMSPNKNTVVCNGSMEAIFAIPQLLKTKKAGVIVPTFWAFEFIINKLNIPLKKSFLKIDNNLKYNIQDIDELAKECDLIYICNPNNPTSSFIHPQKLMKIIKKYKDCHFMIDESHILLKNNHMKLSLLNHIKNFSNVKNVTLIYCLSKMFSVAGCRIGAMVSNKNTVKLFKDWQIPYSLNTLAQAFFPLALKDRNFVNSTRTELHDLRKSLIKMLQTIKELRVIPSNTNFILCEIKNGSSAVNLISNLEKEKFYIRELTTHYKDFPGEWIRISVNNTYLNTKLVEAIKCHLK
ncbi:MAG: aminotransferase class I/II-fold pyridoxal phosphate-dependent enzyme [Endomicrobia bacterium]|nr:aminotransferase class I/II-fold pyridoxal phosphate-dependent enzyme [Endomicrobiia bacterium]